MYGIYLSIDIEEVDPVAIAGQHGQDLTYEGPLGDEFTSSYEAKYGEAPRTPYSAYVYDAVLMAAEAINSAGSEDPAAIRDALDEIGQASGFEGSTGTIQLDADGQRAEQEFGIFEVDDEGKMQEIDALPGAEG
jgi:branched-chain amino acid transport system substrate-binding protein